jgi:citronellol/citronellal dehydrogenase
MKRTGTLDTPMKKYDLMNQVNARGTYLWYENLFLNYLIRFRTKNLIFVLIVPSSKVAIPYLLKSKNPHILNISPPLSLNPKWFRNNVGKKSIY